MSGGLVARRLVGTIPVLVFVSLVVFLLLHLAPGDPAVKAAGGIGEATPEAVAEIRERLGLNDPILVQYASWIGDLATGNLGTSLFSSQPVSAAILSVLPVTLSLTAIAAIVALLIGASAGMIAAYREGGIADRCIMLATSMGIALPSFFVGLILVIVFSLRLGWFPATSYVPLTESPGLWLWHLTLPAVALGLGVSAEVARHLRASLRDVLAKDYIRTAAAKGLPTWKVVGKHGLKNAAMPVVTVLGLQFERLLSGTVVIELVFGLPGMGSLAVRSIFNRDYPMIQGITITAVIIVLVTNLLVDLSYGYLDPRVRSQ